MLRRLGDGGGIHLHVDTDVLSPTVCVGPSDVVTGGPPPLGVGCRLDLPSVTTINAAIDSANEVAAQC